MHAYDPAAWTDYFVAITGAAAALAGLLFVAVSINLGEILKEDSLLPRRAGETLAMLIFVVLSSALALVPQDTVALGIEVLVVAVPFAAMTIANQVHFRRTNPTAPWLWSLGWAATCAGLYPALIGGISLLVHGGGGLYWLVGASLAGIVGAVWSAWVLLVEIVPP